MPQLAPSVNAFKLSDTPLPDVTTATPPLPSSSTPTTTWSSSATSSTPAHTAARRSSSYLDNPTQFSRKKSKYTPSSTPIQSSSVASSFPRHTSQLVGIHPPRARPRPRPLPSFGPFDNPPGSTLTADASDKERAALQATLLSPGQQSVVAAVLAGRSVFFTGCAGTGKSFLLNHLRLMLPQFTTSFTASTGLAAVNVQGSTLHSFAGVGLGQGTKEQLYEQVNARQGPKSRWRHCRILVVDEVSMIDCALFDKLEYLARRIRRCEAPFGGIQLILTGDFLQLPPVQGAGFCFESARWAECVHEVIELEAVFRQEDGALVSVLNSVRRGVIDATVVRTFQSCINRRFDTSDGIVATQLFATRAQVSDENVERLNQLTSDPITYTAHDRGQATYLDTLRKSCNAADSLTLKVGAQVMLLKNLSTDRGLVNGSRGVVVSFQASPDEGHGLDTPLDWRRIRTGNEWPCVRFINGAQLICTPESWSLEIGSRAVATRTQVPLMLAWSLTMHKCQGMTLDRVSLHLGSVFAHGQAYVALSRIRSLTSLSIQDRFDANVINAHPKALKFYDDLRTARGKGAPAAAKPQPSLPSSSQPARDAPAAPSASGWGMDDDDDEDYMALLIEQDAAHDDHDEPQQQQSQPQAVKASSQFVGLDVAGVFPNSAQLAFVPASQLAKPSAPSVKREAPSLLSLVGSKANSSHSAQQARSSSERKAARQRQQGEREEIDLLSDDDDHDGGAVKSERLDGSVKMDVEPGVLPSLLSLPLLEPPHSSVAVKAERMVAAVSSAAVAEFAPPSQPGSAAPLPPRRGPGAANPFAAPRIASSGDLLAVASASPTALSASSSSSSSAVRRLSASTRPVKSLHPFHSGEERGEADAGGGPLLRAVCRAHGEALAAVPERKEGEEEKSNEGRGSLLDMDADERKEAQPEALCGRGRRMWLYRCPRGCTMSVTA